MKGMASLLVAVAMAALLAAYTLPVSGQGGEGASPIYGLTIPAGYRDWKLISVGRVGGSNNDLRAKLGNDIAIKAYREGKLPFPDGTIIARLAWREATSEENNLALGNVDSFVTGAATNLEFMVKDSKKYAATGGWGFAQFTDGKPDSEALHKTCFPCHGPAKDQDFVFTRYAP
ncbi:MAG TPA: cytochrome P460 family protein [Candidatus Acidoferrum sp.]|nr:cytochrome P460 family protein [Candidatus Acidoferrum sp.]HXZ40606.1 cytochrome P460 family protein [Terriglobales bacterium]